MQCDPEGVTANLQDNHTFSSTLPLHPHPLNPPLPHETHTCMDTPQEHTFLTRPSIPAAHTIICFQQPVSCLPVCGGHSLWVSCHPPLIYGEEAMWHNAFWCHPSKTAELFQTASQMSVNTALSCYIHTKTHKDRETNSQSTETLAFHHYSE